MRAFRRAALGATVVALIVSACTSGGSSPSASAAPTVGPSTAASSSAAASPSPSTAGSGGTIASQLTLGGPPECPQRPFCEPGLKDTYGITFKLFLPLDAGGPLSLSAVNSGLVDVSLLFTSDPSIQVEQPGPARGRQAPPEGRQPRAGRAQRSARQGTRPGRPDQPVHGEAHPGSADRPQQAGHGRRQGREVGRRRVARHQRPADRRDVRQRDHGQGRLDELLRAGDPRRDLRPGPRGQRLHGRSEVPARQPGSRLPGAREGRHRHPRRVRGHGPRVRQQGGR